MQRPSERERGMHEVNVLHEHFGQIKRDMQELMIGDKVGRVCGYAGAGDRG
jgi:hypothetical protein